MQSYRQLEFPPDAPDILTAPNATHWKQPDISLLDVIRALRRDKSTIGLSVIISAAIMAGIALLLPVKYKAEAVIFTPQQSQSSLSAMAQLTGLGSAAGLSSLGLLSGLGLRSSSDLYVGILESRTIADSLIKKFNLKQVYHRDTFYTTRKQLRRNTTIKAGRDTLIHIQVEDRDPRRAAQIANAYVDELAEQNSNVALSEASQRRIFYESQLAKEKDALSDSEVALRDTQQSTGLVAPTGQAEGLIRAVSQLHAEILTREAQLAAMKTYATDDNPRLQTVKREVSALHAELDKLERGNHIPGIPEVAAGQLPEAGLQYVRKYRDFKYHETLFEILAKQYEAARLDEAKAAPMIQAIDRAVPPEKKSWPPRTLLTLIAAGLAACISSFWILMRERTHTGRE
ncbi:MAG: lipopolysaccharide biosynthesis protein [Acidobacteriaceae bacterium]|nr:lipopolysaccharide biosynthesis protein [Acidobacteriaceae bacterium]MBV9500773.1 lipopolysaccharide biosynthesis protein [Acidobacteriaceae bacterium]